jgi:glycine dehydrogenase subunit 2
MRRMIVERLAAKGIIAGVPVSRLEPGRPELADLLLVAATETVTDDDRAAFAAALSGGAVMMNTQGRPTRPADLATVAPVETFTGNRGLQIEEALIFEIGRPDVTGVDLPPAPKAKSRLGKHARRAPLGLPGLTEPETMRHYVRLSRKNYAIDLGLYPLGSCTMKHNPRLNEKMARLPGFGDIHPLQPLSTVKGAVELMQELSHWLLDDDRHGGRGAVAEGGRARRALRHDGDQGGAWRRAARAARSCWCRNRAHGTNPATAAQLGYKVKCRCRRGRTAPSIRRR